MSAAGSRSLIPLGRLGGIHFREVPLRRGFHSRTTPLPSWVMSWSAFTPSHFWPAQGGWVKCTPGLKNVFRQTDRQTGEYDLFVGYDNLQDRLAVCTCLISSPRRGHSHIGCAMIQGPHPCSSLGPDFRLCAHVDSVVLGAEWILLQIKREAVICLEFRLPQKRCGGD